jgi:alkaline phosphatase D
MRWRNWIWAAIAALGSGCDPSANGVEQLVVTVRTGAGPNDGADGHVMSLCVTPTKCFPLDHPRIDDYRVDGTDVYHFEHPDIGRAELDRVELVSGPGNDGWRPECVSIEIDGSMEYCRDGLDVTLGNGPGELARWRDPSPSAPSACTSCTESRLTHGPLLGSVTPSSARIWLRTDAAREVDVTLVDPDGATVESTAGLVRTEPSRDYTTVAVFNDLHPETQYTYRVTVDGRESARAHFETPRSDGSPGLTRFAFGSCARYDRQPIFSKISATEPDLFLFVGDSHYGNTAELSSLRAHYRRGFEIPERAALLASVPTLATWDDHDFTGNNHDATTLGAAGREVALRVFGEYWANPSMGTDTTPGVFFDFEWGDLQFFMLDSRYYRGVDGTMLGKGQTEWLRSRLKDSDATFKFIVNGSQFTTHGTWESWKAFPEERKAFFDFIRDEGVEGVVLLSGDVHGSEFRSLARSEDGGYDLPELTSSPLATWNHPCDSDSEQLACADDDMFFVTVDVNTVISDPSLTARIVDGSGVARAEWTIHRSALSLP